MKKTLVTQILFLHALTTQGQIAPLRYHDDFSYLEADTVQKRGAEQLKYIALPPGGHLSIGGEIREQLQYRNVTPAASGRRPDNWQLLHRAMVHASLEPSARTRVFAQFGSTFRLMNPHPPVPEIDENHLSLHQLFIEHQFNKHWCLRAGRQEKSYGSHRLLTFREGPNTRFAFDGAIVRYHVDRSTVELLALSPVVSKKGVFDDVSSGDLVAGVYATNRVIPRKLSIDYYLLHVQTLRRKYSDREGKDSRRIAGLRVLMQHDGVRSETELTYQSGTFNQLPVRAYSISGDISVSLLPQDQLTVGLAGIIVSGDKSSEDKQVNTYSTLYSKSQFGQSVPIGASNIIALQPYLRVKPSKNLRIQGGIWLMWRQSVGDGLYTPDGNRLPVESGIPPANGERSIGTLLVLESQYTVSPYLTIGVDAAKFFAGRVIRPKGGRKELGYLSVKVALKF